MNKNIIITASFIILLMSSFNYTNKQTVFEIQKPAGTESIKTSLEEIKEEVKMFQAITIKSQARTEDQKNIYNNRLPGSRRMQNLVY